MPGEDGYQFLRALRAQPKERGSGIPAIALTAYAYAEDRRRSLEAGLNYHLPKPVNFTDLLHAVHNLVSVRDPPWR